MFRRLFACVLWLVSAAPVVHSAETVFAPINSGELRARVVAWAQQRGLPDDRLQALVSAWDRGGSAAAEPPQLLEQAVNVWGQADPDIARFVDGCRHLETANLGALEEFVSRPGLDPFVSSNLRAYLGRALGEQRMYDEALQQFAKLDVTQAIDPATVLFYQAVAAQQILEISTAITSLDMLLKQTERVPTRYSTIAELMQTELAGLQSQSLDEIARMMHDSERRLDLGRAGERVQGVQERIVAGLDELIKKLEAQQGGGGGGSGSGASNQSSQAADDSRVKGSTAPGETDERKFSKQGSWGDLPEKQQTEAKNLINREFPSHYRQAIETYFKKLAGRPAPADK